MKIKKRHMVLASLVLALSAAVYLNWQLSDSKSLAVSDTTKELGAATYVNSNINTTTDEYPEPTGYSPSSKLSPEQSEYFSSARMDRDTSQDDAIELAKDVLELADSSDEAKEDAVGKLSELEDRILCQNRIENTLKAKGFSECLCYLSDYSCTIIVPKNEMTEDMRLSINSCVKESAEISFENISVVEV